MLRELTSPSRIKHDAIVSETDKEKNPGLKEKFLSSLGVLSILGATGALLSLVLEDEDVTPSELFEEIWSKITTQLTVNSLTGRQNHNVSFASKHIAAWANKDLVIVVNGQLNEVSLWKSRPLTEHTLIDAHTLHLDNSVNVENILSSLKEFGQANAFTHFSSVEGRKDLIRILGACKAATSFDPAQQDVWSNADYYAHYDLGVSSYTTMFIPEIDYYIVYHKQKHQFYAIDKTRQNVHTLYSWNDLFELVGINPEVKDWKSERVIADIRNLDICVKLYSYAENNTVLSIQHYKDFSFAQLKKGWVIAQRNSDISSNVRFIPLDKWDWLYFVQFFPNITVSEMNNIASRIRTVPYLYTAEVNGLDSSLSIHSELKKKYLGRCIDYQYLTPPITYFEYGMYCAFEQHRIYIPYSVFTKEWWMENCTDLAVMEQCFKAIAELKEKNLIKTYS